MKQCYSCGDLKESYDYHKDSSKEDGLNIKCKMCKNEHLRKYRQSPSGQLSTRKHNNKKSSIKMRLEYSRTKAGKKAQRKGEFLYSINNRIKRQAKAKVNNEITAGRMIKPSICEVCGIERNKLEGHHWSYKKEHWLDVVWCCIICHNNIHKNEVK